MVSVHRTVLRTVVAGLAGVLVAAGLAAATAPARADTVTSIGTSGFRTMVVDDTHHHVFLARGTTVEVRGFDGALVTTVTGLAALGDIALAGDDSAVWASDFTTETVLRRIDSTTFAVTTHPLGPTFCVPELEFAGTRLFVADSCGQAEPRVVEIDLTGAAPVAGPTLEGTWSRTPQMQGDATGNRLLAWVTGQYGAPAVRSYDLTQDPPVAVSPADATLSCQQGGIPPASGSEAVMLCSGAAGDYSLTDLSSSHTYPVVDLVNAFAVSDTAVAMGSRDTFNVEHAVGQASPPDIYVMARHGDVVVRTIEVDPNGFYTHELASGGLALSGDGTKLFAVVTSPAGLAFHVYDNPLAANSAMSLVAPATSTRTASLTVTGTVTASVPFPAGTVLAVKKTDLTGTHTLPSVTTDAAGAFGFTDSPAVGGTNTYTVSFAGNTQHQAVSASRAVSVSRVTPTLTLTTDHATYGYRATATVKAHLGTTFDGRTVSIYATPVGQAKVLLKTGRVDASGNLTVTRVVGRKTTFSVVFAGDQRYAPRTVTRTVAVHVAMSSTLTGNYATSGKYKLFRTSVNPAFTVAVSPQKDLQCVYFRIQRYAAGAWRPEVLSGCFNLNGSSTSSVLVTGTHVRGVSFRMRAEYGGDTQNVATNGAWKYFRFP